MSDVDLQEVSMVAILFERPWRELIRKQIRKARLAQLQEQSGGAAQNAGRAQEEQQKCVVMISTHGQNQVR